MTFKVEPQAVRKYADQLGEAHRHAATAKTYVNKNQLIGTYRGADGVKTGWTTIAGHCLVASARRGGTRLIAVVLHAPDPYGDARRLLNFGFANS